LIFPDLACGTREAVVTIVAATSHESVATVDAPAPPLYAS
jgi:hypothetical protein